MNANCSFKQTADAKRQKTTYDHVLMRGVHRVDNGNLKFTNT